MSNNLIDRYLYDVTRRLPEGERGELRRELRANIDDMLPENATDADMEALLLELGDPALLAEKYRQKPRYLISPAVFERYIRTLQRVLPLVGGILLVVGLALGGFEAVRSGGIAQIIATALEKGFSMGFSGALQTLFWITLGFFIAERAGASANAKPWQPSALPEIPPQIKRAIPLSDSIAELVVILLTSAAAMLFCSGKWPLDTMLSYEGVEVQHIFSESFLAACIPATAALAALGLLSGLLKLAFRRWTPRVCAGVLLDGVLSCALALSMLHRTDLLHADFIAFLRSDTIGLPQLAVSGFGNPLVIGICAVIVIITLAECGSAVYRTVSAPKKNTTEKSAN